MANTLTYSAAGEAKALSLTLAGENLTMKLYTACATSGGVPTAASVVGDFTEATFTGYSAKTLTGSIGAGTWATPSGTPSSSQYNSGSPQTFTLTAGTQTILGYYYVGASTSTFYGAQAFVSSIALSTGQPSFTIIPAVAFGTLPVATS